MIIILITVKIIIIIPRSSELPVPGGGGAEGGPNGQGSPLFAI